MKMRRVMRRPRVAVIIPALNEENLADRFSLRSVEVGVSERTIEWNLAFARDEVVDGIAKLLDKWKYSFFRADSQEDLVFQVCPPQGTLSLTIRPLMAHQSLFNPQATLHRTLLITRYSGFSPDMEEALQRGLTLTFLRVGG
jgi:hypothetical protein